MCVNFEQIFAHYISEAYSELRQTSKIEGFKKIVNG